MRLEREKSWCAARRRHAGRFMSSSKTSEYVSGDIIMVDGGMEGEECFFSWHTHYWFFSIIFRPAAEQSGGYVAAEDL
jgi:hypothetical protein